VTDKDPQTHFAVRISGKLYKLLSILQLPSDELIITTHAPSTVWGGATPEHKSEAIVHKHTVHMSSRSKDGGKFIHHSQLLREKNENGKHLKVDLGCYTLAMKSKTFQPIYIRAVARMDRRWGLEPNGGDQVICVGDFDQVRDSLIYALIVSAADQMGQIPNSLHFEAFRAPFRAFNIDLLVAGASFPSHSVGCFAHVVTSQPRVPFGPGAPPQETKPVDGLPLGEVPDWAEHHLNLTAARYARMISDAVKDERTTKMLEQAAATGVTTLAKLAKEWPSAQGDPAKA